MKRRTILTDRIKLPVCASLFQTSARRAEGSAALRRGAFCFAERKKGGAARGDFRI